MEQLIDMVVVSFERTKTHAMPQCVESGSAYGFMQRVSVAMAGVVPLLSRFTCAHLRQVLSVSTLCLFSVSVGVQLVCNFVPAQRTQRVSVAMAGVVLSVSVRRVMLDVLLITSRIAIGTGTARIAMVINVHGVCWCVTSVGFVQSHTQVTHKLHTTDTENTYCVLRTRRR